MSSLSDRQIKTVLAILFFKIIIIIFLPLMGDEAYFIKWASHLSSGYYDHPPMVGWVIYVLSLVNDSYVFFRLFSFLTGLVIAYVIYKISEAYGVEKEKSFLLYMIFLVSPIDVLLSILSNDIVLVFFGSFATLFLVYSLENQEKWLRFAVLSGVFFAFTFLSKYFAAFLMFSLLIFAVYSYKMRSLKTVVVVAIFVLLAVAQNLYFNYNSCWNNILFNFFARTQAEYNINTVLNFFAIIAYIVTPWGLWYLFRAKFEKGLLLNLIVSVLAVVFVIFFMVSLKNTVGIHWFLLFIPFIYLLFAYLSVEKLKKLFKYNAVFSAVHIVILLSVIFIPKSIFQDHKKYSYILIFSNPESVCKHIDHLSDDELYIDGYVNASILSYYCKRDLKMLFDVSKYGRFDDKLVDVRELDSKDVYIFDKRELKPKEYTACESFDVEVLDVEGAKFYLGKCSSFSYEKYKEDFLDTINDKYYNIPSWFPVGECYFKERYYK